MALFLQTPTFFMPLPRQQPAFMAYVSIIPLQYPLYDSADTRDGRLNIKHRKESLEPLLRWLQGNDRRKDSMGNYTYKSIPVFRGHKTPVLSRHIEKGLRL